MKLDESTCFVAVAAATVAADINDVGLLQVTVDSSWLLLGGVAVDVAIAVAAELGAGVGAGVGVGVGAGVGVGVVLLLLRLIDEGDDGTRLLLLLDTCCCCCCWPGDAMFKLIFMFILRLSSIFFLFLLDKRGSIVNDNLYICSSCKWRELSNK